MKRIARAVLAAALMTGGLCAGSARAEEGGKDGRRAAFAEKMKERLGLTDDQAEKLKAAWESRKAALKPLIEQRKSDQRKLEDQVRDLASEKDIQATMDRLDAGRKAMEAERQKGEASVASILKPSQRAKMRLFRAKAMKRRFHGGRAGRGHGRKWRHHREG